MKLVICEKNIAARRIAQILSKGTAKMQRINTIPVYEFEKDGEAWAIIGLKGHILNLDYPTTYRRWDTTPPNELITVEPVKKISEKAIALALKKLVAENPFIIIATDFDREGELIGVEAINLAREYNAELTTIKRTRFSAITGYEIHDAFEKLVQVDYNLANAGEARQIIDLVWGVVLTRFISLTSRRLGNEFLSIGRVQSPTLALLVEREKAIKKFIPEPYWRIIARLKKEKSFEAVHSEERFWDESQAKNIYDRVQTAKQAQVISITVTTNIEYPPPPFNTTMFLQAASSQGLSTTRAMELAESLYMAGLISYPRTDNTVYPSSLNIKGILLKLTESSFAKEVHEVLQNGRKSPTCGKKKTTDHPPTHPVGAPKNKKLSGEQLKIYELICRRFLATLAKDAISESTKAVFDINRESFIATGYQIKEQHWRAIYPYFREKTKSIPTLVQGELVNISSMKLEHDETKPPKRYSQGELLAKMEGLSLGTKSTRHEIISKLYARKYISGSPPIPTSTAIAVVDALADYEVVKPQMTATLEEDMNAIAEGKKSLEEIVEESRQMLQSVMRSLEENKESIKTSIQKAHREQNHMGTCPQCGEDLILRTSRRGKRFVGCTGYPNCTNTYPLPQRGGIDVTDRICSVCGTPIIFVKQQGKKRWELCLNQKCSSKKNNFKS
ncbi:MAG: DNA topoisomerase I [Candidatus Omnitrophica bacterium]|nr:DNA topoisomerase I [Candidatus Omnitrophota bacterium]